MKIQSLASSETENKQDKELIIKLKRDIETQKEINKITERISAISGEISTLEKEKDKSITNVKFFSIIGLEVLFGLVFVILLVLLICAYFKDGNDVNTIKDYISKNVGLLLGTCITAIGFVCRIQKMYLFSPKIEFLKNRNEQVMYWIQKNPHYNELKEELNDLQNKRTKLNLID